MKRKIILASLSLLLVIMALATPALAKENQTNGTPFDEIWAAIKGLEQQIADIQLTPGPEGPAGPQGPQGIPGPTVFARVSSGGTLVASSPGVTILPHDSARPGYYRLVFPQSLDGCALTATLMGTPVSGEYVEPTIPKGIIGAGMHTPFTNHVSIVTRNLAGQETDMGFMVVIACPSP